MRVFGATFGAGAFSFCDFGGAVFDVVTGSPPVGKSVSFAGTGCSADDAAIGTGAGRSGFGGGSWWLTPNVRLLLLRVAFEGPRDDGGRSKSSDDDEVVAEEGAEARGDQPGSAVDLPCSAELVATPAAAVAAACCFSLGGGTVTVPGSE